MSSLTGGGKGLGTNKVKVTGVMELTRSGRGGLHPLPCRHFPRASQRPLSCGHLGELQKGWQQCPGLWKLLKIKTLFSLIHLPSLLGTQLNFSLHLIWFHFSQGDTLDYVQEFLFFSLWNNFIYFNFFIVNIFKHSIRENSVINLHVPIFHLTSVLNFAVFVPPLPYTIGGWRVWNILKQP